MMKMCNRINYVIQLYKSPQSKTIGIYWELNLVFLLPKFYFLSVS